MFNFNRWGVLTEKQSSIKTIELRNYSGLHKHQLITFSIFLSLLKRTLSKYVNNNMYFNDLYLRTRRGTHVYSPWSVVASRVPAAGDGSHVVLGFLHLIPCEALRLLCVVGGGHGSVGVPRARRIVVEGATLCGLGHAPHRGHHREAWGTLIPRHPTSIGVTTTQTMKRNSVLISNNPWVKVISNCDLWTVTYKCTWKCEITENIESFQVFEYVLWD